MVINRKDSGGFVPDQKKSKRGRLRSPEHDSAEKSGSAGSYRVRWFPQSATKLYRPSSWDRRQKRAVILFSFSLIFQLITLPVEFNASSRALQILDDSNMLYDEELKGAKKVLSAAAMTYVAAAISTLLSLLRLIILFGGRRRND